MGKLSRNEDILLGKGLEPIYEDEQQEDDSDDPGAGSVGTGKRTGHSGTALVHRHRPMRACRKMPSRRIGVSILKRRKKKARKIVH